MVHLREKNIGAKVVSKVANHVHPAHICICRSPCLLCRVCSPNCGSLYDVADQRYQWGLLVICLLGWVVRSLRKNPLSLRIWVQHSILVVVYDHQVLWSVIRKSLNWSILILMWYLLWKGPPRACHRRRWPRVQPIRRWGRQSRRISKSSWYSEQSFLR